MTDPKESAPAGMLIMIAGAKGAVAATLAAAVKAMAHGAQTVLPSLTTADKFNFLGPVANIALAGWDTDPRPLSQRVEAQGILPADLWRPLADGLDAIPILTPPDTPMDFSARVDHLTRDMNGFRRNCPGARPVLVNLLPACIDPQVDDCQGYEKLCQASERICSPDLAYAAAAIRNGIPVVNFAPNRVEVPALVAESKAARVPICGRDGKTGQTFFKVVMASALKSRGLYVDGWYSTNILGNADGQNLMDPEKAAGKVSNKTRLLDDLLGYRVGERYGTPAHTVRIDYYPPRGDAKEAWDVIDVRGLFGLPMSIRLNLQGRDSILAAPMALDLARWTVALHMAGFAGPVPQLGFFFKKPVGENPPLTFQDQLAALDVLERDIETRMA
jgi:myo-inositol-1-phosphate synthase